MWKNRLAKKYFTPIILVFLLLVGLFFYLFNGSTTSASEEMKIKIFPTSYTNKNIALQEGEASWQNSEAAFSQDLNENASFEEFNKENSAHIFSSSATSTPIFIGSTTSTPEAILEFSDFGVGGEIKKNKIKNVQLRFSLAGKPHETALNETQNQAKLIIEYQSSNGWQDLGEINFNQEKSNAINNGYWFYALPVFGSWQDLENLKVGFVYQGGEAKIYLDSVWLEVEYEKELFPKKIQASLDRNMIFLRIDKKTRKDPIQPVIRFSVFNFGPEKKIVNIRNIQPYFLKEIDVENISYQVEIPEFGPKTLRCDRGWTLFERIVEKDKYQCPTKVGKRISYCDSLSEDKKYCYNSNAYLGFHQETKSGKDEIKIPLHSGLKCKIKMK